MQIVPQPNKKHKVYNPIEIVLNTWKENEPVHPLVANVIPHVLNQVILDLHMSMSIMRLMMELGSVFKHCRFLVLRQYIFTLIFEPLVAYVVTKFILHDLVVHVHISSHHLPKILSAPYQFRV